MNTKIPQQLSLEDWVAEQKQRQSPTPPEGMVKKAEGRRRVSLDELKSWLKYDPETGEFFWIRDTRKTKAGSKAGNINSSMGYVEIMLNYINYRAHRLAWFYHYGIWPNVIDHINLLKSDNRISNLRNGTHAQNSQNRVTPLSSSKTGLMGVHYHTHSGLWHACITVGGKIHSLKYHKSPELAHAAYLEAKRKMHEFCTL